MENRFPKIENLSFDWNDLKFFLAVARHGGLSGAATALGTSPSTVSRHVDALEKRFDMTLFLRQQTGYLLTDDGAELMQHIEQVEQAMMATERNSHRSAREEVSGHVRLATTEMLALHLVVPQLPLLRARYPKLRVELNIALARANLSRREADLALRLTAPDEGAGDYIASRSGFMSFGVYCAASLPLPQAHDAEADAWNQLDYVSWDDTWADLPMAKWLHAAFRGKPPALAVNSLQAQYAAVRAGLGVGLLPRFIGDRDPALRRIESAAAPPSRELWLVYHRDLKASRRVLAMRDFLVELIGRNLGAQ